MTYVAGEALIKTAIQGVAGFSSTNVTQGKWGVLNSGKAAFYAILKRGAFKRTQFAMASNETIWQTVVQVWQRYKDDGTTYTDLLGHCDAVIAYLDAHRKLGDTTSKIYDALVTDGREVEEMWTKGGGLSWLKQDLIVTWKETNDVTYAE